MNSAIVRVNPHRARHAHVLTAKSSLKLHRCNPWHQAWGSRRLDTQASAVPSQPTPAASDPASGATLGSQAAGGSPADNGTAAGAAASAAAAAAPRSGGNQDDGLVQVSGRGRFGNIVKYAYIGEALFVVLGSLICVAVAQWTVGTPLRRFNPYSFHVILAEAPGVALGTPVRMKGVPIGSVLVATPQLHRVSVEVEVNESKTIIPRNSRVELTQSGLIPAASIDISPPEGVSAEALTAAVAASAAGAKRGGGGRSAAAGGEAGEVAAGGAASARAARRAARVRLASPKDVEACRMQGVLVCQGDQLEGLQGGSMDELTARMLKTLRQGEEEATVPGAGIVPGRGPVQG